MEATFETPHGRWVRMDVRPDTSDWNTVNAITRVGDEYSLPSGQEGWACDVGAHIGAWSVALLVDNPAMRCVAIEALPENVALIERNAELNGVRDRLVVLHGGASIDHEKVEVRYSTDEHHRFIGSAGGAGDVLVLPGVTLADVLALVEAGGGDRIALLKIDCEGCEYPFLTSMAIGRVERIVGEVHFGSEQLRAVLLGTHDVEFPAYAENPDFGPFRAWLHSDATGLTVGDGPE